jgi:hypothetical protein
LLIDADGNKLGGGCSAAVIWFTDVFKEHPSSASTYSRTFWWIGSSWTALVLFNLYYPSCDLPRWAGERPKSKSLEYMCV